MNEDKKELCFKDVFIREINKCKDHLNEFEVNEFEAESAKIKYTFFDKKDENLIHEICFIVKKKDNEND